MTTARSGTTAREKHPDAKPRIITDNGLRFIARDGKIERHHRTIKGDSIRVTLMWTIENACRAVIDYVEHYNEVCFHSEIGYASPHAKRAEKEKDVLANRDSKLKLAREQRQTRRATARQSAA